MIFNLHEYIQIEIYKVWGSKFLPREMVYDILMDVYLGLMNRYNKNTKYNFSHVGLLVKD